MSKLAVVSQLHDADPSVVEYLEKMLVKAKAGQLRGICFASVSPGHFIGTGWAIAPDVNVQVLNSAVSVLFHRFVKTMVEQAEDSEI